MVEETKKKLLNHLDPITHSRIQGGASKEARLWLHCPEGEYPMAEPHYHIAARMRYNVKDPSPKGECTCHNIVPWLGRVCGAPCQSDGGTTRTGL